MFTGFFELILQKDILRRQN